MKIHIYSKEVDQTIQLGNIQPSQLTEYLGARTHTYKIRLGNNTYIEIVQEENDRIIFNLEPSQ